VRTCWRSAWEWSMFNRDIMMMIMMIAVSSQTSLCIYIYNSCTAISYVFGMCVCIYFIILYGVILIVASFIFLSFCWTEIPLLRPTYIIIIIIIIILFDGVIIHHDVCFEVTKQVVVVVVVVVVVGHPSCNFSVDKSVPRHTRHTSASRRDVKNCSHHITI
jgi:hypothetical protein